MINVLVVEPNKFPYEKQIENTLEAKQEIVGGLIEDVTVLGDDKVRIICNEEGKYLNLPLNRDIGYDIIAGTFIVVGVDEDDEDYLSLTDEQIEKYKVEFGEESIKRTHKKIEDLLFKKSKIEEREY